jgi:dihydrofolate reductase
LYRVENQFDREHYLAIFLSTTGHSYAGCGMSRSPLSILVAMALNRTIGLNNGLPWRCPEDLKRFKALTWGHQIIMGRKTFDSIGKPLPGRTTTVVTRDRDLTIAGCHIAHSLEMALEACNNEGEIFIVGGADIYAQALPLIDTLYITEIRQVVEGDVFFPEFSKTEWQEISREMRHQETPQPLEYHFVIYRRIPASRL